jgi:hypothetical protein
MSNKTLVIDDPRNNSIVYLGAETEPEKWSMVAIDKNNPERIHTIVKGVPENELYLYAAAIYSASANGLTKEATGKTINKTLKATIKSVKDKA